MEDYWGLRRSTTDAPVAGVCGGLAERWRIDPLVVRLAMVVAMLSAGIGVVLYAAAVLLVPTTADDTSQLVKMHPPAREWPPRTVIAVVGIITLMTAVIAGSFFPLSIMPVVFLVAAWYFGFYRPQQRATTTAAQPEPAALPATLSGTTLGSDTTPPPSPGLFRSGSTKKSEGEFFPHYRQHPPAAPASRETPRTPAHTFAPVTVPTQAPAPKPVRRAASRWRWSVLGAMALSIVVLVLVHLFATPVSAAVGFAVPAIIGAIGLIVATWVGRARGMLLPTVVATLGALVAVSPHYVDIDVSGFTEPAAPTVYTELPTEITSDLRDIHADLRQVHVPDDAGLVVRNQIGGVTLWLPDDVTVVVEAYSEVGNLHNHVTDEQVTDFPAQARWEFAAADPDAPVLTIDVSTAIGDVEVHR